MQSTPPAIRPLSPALWAILLTIVLAACSRETSVEPGLAITGVHVIPMGEGAGEPVLPDRTVLIRGDRIVAVGPAGRTPIPEGARRIDGTGRFLIPGLADMHVHVDHPSELGLYPAYGVTTVLNMRGLAKHLDWRDEIARGERFGPTLLTAGDYMDGYPPMMQPMMAFDSAEEAAAAVRRQQAAGYDFIKVYTRLEEDQFSAIAEAAAAAGIAVVGHASGNYPLETLVDGQVNVAHGEDLIRWYWERDRSEASMDEIVATLSGSGTTVTANLNFSRSLIRQKEDLEGLLEQDEARYLHPAIFQPFRRINNRYARRDDAWLGRVRDQQELKKTLMGKLAEAGVPLLAGTDASTAGVFPGRGLYEELEELVDAGLTAFQALAAATREPGRFVERHRPGGAPFGQVAEGYRADLVLLEADPLKDIRNVAAVSGVVLRGRFLDADELKDGLEQQAEAHRPLAQAVEALEQHVYAGRIEEARALFDEVRAEDPDAILFSQYVPFFVGYGFLYGEDGFNPDPRRREVALGLYRMYAETYPEFHSAHYQLGLAWQANDNAAEAIASFERALELHPAYPDARRKLDELQAAQPRASQP